MIPHPQQLEKIASNAPVSSPEDSIDRVVTWMTGRLMQEHDRNTTLSMLRRKLEEHYQRLTALRQVAPQPALSDQEKADVDTFCYALSMDINQRAEESGGEFSDAVLAKIIKLHIESNVGLLRAPKLAAKEEVRQAADLKRLHRIGQYVRSKNIICHEYPIESVPLDEREKRQVGDLNGLFHELATMGATEVKT